MPQSAIFTEYEHFFKMSLDLLLIARGDGIILHVNPAWTTCLGYSIAEICGQSVFDFILAEDRAASIQAAQGLTVGQDVIYFENRYHVKGGGFRWISWTASFTGETGNLYAIGRDITQEKNDTDKLKLAILEHQVQQSSNLLLELSAQVPGVIYQFQLWPDGRACFPFASEAIQEIYEVSPEEVREDGTAALARLHPDDTARVQASIQRSANALSDWSCEYRVILPQQGLRWRQGSARPQRLDDGSTLWHGFITDITDRKASEQALRANEQKFRVLFEESSEAHLLFDESGIIDCNLAAIHLLRANDKSQIMSLHPAVLSPEFQPDGTRSLEKSVRMDSIAREKGSHRFEWMHQRLDGTVFPVEVMLSHINLMGKPAILVVWHDLSAQKANEEALKSALSLLKASLDSIHDGVLVVGLDRQVSMFNQRFADIWKIPQSMLKFQDHQEIRAFVRDQIIDPVSFAAKVEFLYQQLDLNSTDIIALKDGRTIERYSQAQILDGKIIGRVWSFRDISRQVALDKLKSEFISTVSHELRTPLTSIRGTLGLVTAGKLGTIPEQAQHFLQVGLRNSERLACLIDDLLDSEKIEAIGYAIETKKVQLAPLLLRSMSDNQSYADIYKVAFQQAAWPEDLWVQANPERLLQVMANLLSNAAKFSAPESTVDISVTIDNAFAKIAITDHGEGIPVAFYPRIFQKFSQADSSDTRKKGGTGLGLNITKTLVEKMGGEINFQSQPGVGTTFTFSLKRA